MLEAERKNMNDSPAKMVIVIGCYVGGYGVIRSLGMMGFQIIALHYSRTDFGHVSKYVHESFRVPHPCREEKDFIDFLIDNSDKWKGAIIFDTDDEVTVSISKNKAKLAEHYKVVTAEWEILRKFLDKQETYRLAEKCGVPHPKTFLPKTWEQLDEIKDKITYPCILKPFYGHEFMSKFKSKNFKVNDYGELLSKFQLCLESKLDVLVQEVIPEADSDLYRFMVYINSEGEVNAKFFRKKIRQNPPQFGVTRVGISHDRVPEIEEHTMRLLNEVNYKGYAESDFKKDPRDNKLKLIEINSRLVRPNWLATYCGINFPWIMYMDMVEKRQVKANDYRKDVYWIDMYQDILNSVARHGEEKFGFREYVKPYLSKDKTFVLSTDDLVPLLRQFFFVPIYSLVSRFFVKSLCLIAACKSSFIARIYRTNKGL